MLKDCVKVRVYWQGLVAELHNTVIYGKQPASEVGGPRGGAAACRTVNTQEGKREHREGIEVIWPATIQPSKSVKVLSFRTS